MEELDEKSAQNKAWEDTLHWLETTKYEFNVHEMTSIQVFGVEEEIKLGIYALAGGIFTTGSNLYINIFSFVC